MQEEILIQKWDGNPINVKNNTPYGIYDDDNNFVEDAKKFAKWAAIKFGYPILDVELNSYHFYSCFEEAVLEYSFQVNQFNIQQNLISVQGDTSNINLTQRLINYNISRIIELSKSYAAEINLSDKYKIRKGYIDIISGKQEYDLNEWANNNLELINESDKKIEIRKIYHYPPAASQRFFDPFVGTGYINIMSEFGFTGYSPSIEFILMPLYWDLLRMQSIELNDTIRRSAYTFELYNNKLKLFPIPTKNFKLYFDYVLVSDKFSQENIKNVASDFSNIKYNYINYSNINDVGKQWIKKYAFALAKIILGTIRSKYRSIPIPGGEVSIDGEILRSEGISEKDALIQELKEILEKTLRKNQIETVKEETNNITEILSKIPTPIIIG